MPLIEHSEADNKDSTAPRTRHHQIPRVEAPRVEAPRVDAAATSTRKRKAHSERGWNVQRNQTKKYIDGVLQCRRAVNLSEKTPPQSASVLIARCLHEPKVNLVKDAIAVLGVKRVVQFYNETVEVQRAGGQCVSNGNTKRAPGGVFLTLIKNSPTVTAAERTEIFKRDKVIVASHKKEAQRRKREAALSNGQYVWRPNFNMRKRRPENQQSDAEGSMASESVGLDNGPEGAELTSTSETPLVMRREEAEPFVIKREAEPFVIKREEAEPFVIEREEAEPFVIKREEAEPFVIKREEAEPFVIKREEAEPFFIKREEAEPFIIKREEAESMQFEESGGMRGGAPPTSQQQVEMDLDEFERTHTVELDIILDDV
ncbi:hypothetical protein EMCRGX_G023511 [Ephydatia muelleri]